MGFNGKKRFVVTESGGNPLSSSGHHMVLTDRRTGVEYLYVQVGYSGGLTVLVDADGKPLRSAPEEGPDEQ